MDDIQKATSPDPAATDPVPTIPDTSKVDIVFKKPDYHPYFQSLFVPFLAVLVLTAGLGVSLILVRQRQNVDSQASSISTTYSSPAPIESQNNLFEDFVDWFFSLWKKISGKR